MFEKVKSFFAEKKAKIAACFAGVVTALTGGVTAMAAEPGSEPGSTAIVSGVTQIWEKLSGTMNVTTIVSIIGICLGACVVLALFWFGARYVTRKITAATKKGKVSV